MGQYKNNADDILDHITSQIVEIPAVQSAVNTTEMGINLVMQNTHQRIYKPSISTLWGNYNLQLSIFILF